MPVMSRMERVIRAHLARDRSHQPGDAADHSLTQMQVAVLCGSHGLPVVPSHGLKNGLCTCGNRQCKHPGRHPRTTKGLRDATSDETRIHELWRRWPKAKIIIATGAPDVIAVTATGRKAEQKLNTLIKEGEASENEPSSETIKFRGRRSVTYLLRAPSDAIPNGRVRLAKEFLFMVGEASL